MDTQEPTSPDLLTLVQEMARDMLNCEMIRSPDPRWLQEGRDARVGWKVSQRPRVAALPVRNRSRFRLTTELITREIQDTLNQHAKDRIDFIDRSIINDIIQERAKKQENVYDGLAIGKLAGADFFLAGEINDHSVVSSRARSDLVQYSFRLVDCNSGIEAWSKSYLVEKIERSSKLYRSKE